jgi:hypothetical protein
LFRAIFGLGRVEGWGGGKTPPLQQNLPNANQ